MTVQSPRILHLLANFKWTGPADPAIRTAVNLRRAGADVVFGQAAWKPPGDEHRMAQELWRWRMPVTGELELRKHFVPLSVLRDVRRLRRRLERGDFDLLHTHLPGDHLIAALACAGVRPRPLLVRTLYDPRAPARSLRTVFAFHHTDGVVVPSLSVADQMRRRSGFGDGQVLYQDPPVDSDRARTGGDLREHWGLSREQPVIGITARVQPHRRFDLLWEVARRVVDREPTARFVLLGRGGERDVQRLVRDPIRRLGLDKSVVLPGYLREPEYGLAVRSFDLFLFLVPGSDGTCRAVREAMAAGLPVVATRRGILPELLEPDPTVPGAGSAGICCDEDSEELALAILTLLGDDDRRQGLSRGALLRARHSMDPVAAARRLMEFYGCLRGEGR